MIASDFKTPWLAEQTTSDLASVAHLNLTNILRTQASPRILCNAS